MIGLRVLGMIVVSGVALGAQSVDHQLTPGVATTLSQTEVCSRKWGKDVRHVTLAMKKQVFASYGIPWRDHAKYEVDHLISRELGGADDIRNLWPQPWLGPWNAHDKDRAENATHRAVCRGDLTLIQAQRQIALDWTALYDRFVKRAEPR